MEGSLHPVAADLWVAARPLRLWLGDIGSRMTVIRLPGGELLLHSPVALDDATRRAVDEVGAVRWLVGPSRVHHFFLGDWAKAYPGAELCGAPGLEAKRKDLTFSRGLPADAPAAWSPDVELLLFEGAPLMNEVVFLHAPTRTLILTDLAFHRPPDAPDGAPLFHRLVGAKGFGPHRIARLGIRDRAAAAASVERLLQWDFDRVVVSHGEVLETGGRAAMEGAFAYLRA